MQSNLLRQLMIGAFCAQAFCASAQRSYEVKFNESVKDKVRPENFLGTDDAGNIYVASLRHKMKLYLPLAVFNIVNIDVEKHIKKYDKDLNLLENKQVLANNEGVRQSQINGRLGARTFLFFVSVFKKNMDLPSFILDGKYYIVVPNDKKPRNDYYLAEVDMQTGLAGKLTPLFSLGKKREENHLSAEKFECKFSPDSSHIAFIASYKQGFGKTKSIAYSAAVLTRDMKPDWHSQYTLPKITKTFSYKEANVGNHGEITILGRNYNKQQKDNPGYSSVFYMDKTQTKPKEHRLNFQGDFVGEVSLATNADNIPMVIGYYKSKRKQHGYDGLYYANMDTAKNLYNIHKKEFTAEFIGSNQTENTARKLLKKEAKGKDLKESGDFVFTEFLPTTDGGYIGIAEEYYLEERRVTSTTRSGNVTTSQTRIEFIDHYNDLMVFKFDKEGHILSMNKITKNNAYNLGGIHLGKPYKKDYVSCTVGSDNYLIFNDDAGKLDNRTRKGTDMISKRTTYIVHIDDNGNFKKDELIAKEGMGAYTFDPHKEICKLADGRYAFLATKSLNARNRKTKIGSFTIRKS